MSADEVAQKLEKTTLNSVSHPLNTKWTLWYTKPAIDKSESWSDLLRPVTSFKTVEEFWAVQQNVPEPRDLPMKSDYHVFRNDIRPEWEDAANAKGGKWSAQIRGNKHSEINQLWLKAVLSVIGETVDEDESEVNGVVLSVRKGNFKIALWTKSESKEPLQKIGARFKKILELEDDEHLDFFPHSIANVKHPQPAISL
ncbi:hypothetical protein TBLA_0H00220 [Henningerozyma blattae CBS 6284]|uniref:Eukaryotic translation initiation factor 4E n=1 Tax=Henningerozyma blattae (strain ATCC 34711 / CBS 6284 / DSM 70876 / NBRC 10599 / NRRL Y-10934 / UCD 77-7) TaxID=1071380 RepID=I2H7G3_HENB6|nr:hypothetical protein TBLA_0H00220 [Tetrapisispora blattae CBS 6284]CCH62315.1 hypothetical protein TBLA_0H00220 [Tetrapisispora blattae CBS 6284]